MKITKKQLRTIIREAMEDMAAAPDQAAAPPERAEASSQALKNWFYDKYSNISDMQIPAAQIPSLIASMDDIIKAAESGRLKSKEDYLAGQISNVGGF